MTSDQTHSAELMIALEAGEGAADRLEAVLAAVPVASVVAMPPKDRVLTAADVLPLVGAGRGRGVTVLVADDARLARTVKADGVHLSVSDKAREHLEEARAIVGGRAIVGADAGRSRHDAMTIGEVGADYVAFGVPAFVRDRETAFERQLDLVAWWSEIFEIPCVAMDVEGPEQAEALAAAGADFVTLRLPGGLAPVEAVALARQWVAAIASSAQATIEQGESE
jgi:thiamine-phosphate pyrophosphorylase